MKITTSINRLVGAISAQTLKAKTYSQALIAVISEGHFVDFIDFAHSAGISEALNWAVTKFLSDTTNATDTQAKGFGKSATDGATSSDSFNRAVGYDRDFADGVGATDDIYGEADIDDQQYMFFQTTKRDTANATEVFSRTVAYDRDFSDLGNAGDAIALDATKALTDVSTASESFSRTVGFDRDFTDTAQGSDAFSRVMAYDRDFADTSELSEQISNGLGKSLTDTASSSDVFSYDFQFNRDFTDGSAASDSVTRAFGSNFSDSPSSADAFSRVVAFDRGFADGVGATDDLDGEAGVDDDQNMAFFKNRSDSATAGDSAVISAGKVHSDAASSSDSGTLLNQDYVDNPYYFADDYVGAKRTF